MNTDRIATILGRMSLLQYRLEVMQANGVTAEDYHKALAAVEHIQALIENLTVNAPLITQEGHNEQPKDG